MLVHLMPFALVQERMLPGTVIEITYVGAILPIGTGSNRGCIAVYSTQSISQRFSARTTIQPRKTFLARDGLLIITSPEIEKLPNRRCKSFGSKGIISIPPALSRLYEARSSDSSPDAKGAHGPACIWGGATKAVA